MWQRIQTVFLVIVILCMVIGIFFPIGIFTDPATSVIHELYPLQYTTRENGTAVAIAYFPYCVSAILMIASATLAGMSISRYDNRMTQVKIGTLNSLLLAGSMISIVVFFTQFSNKYQTTGLGLVIWITFAASVCNWLALRFIRRDEKLVRDSDRLR